MIQEEESPRKYISLFELSKDAIMLANHKGEVIQGNPAAIKMFGYLNNEEFISLKILDLSPKYQSDGTLSAARVAQEFKTVKEKGSHFFEWKHKRKDGTEFFSAVLLTKIKLKNVIISQAIVQDITENKLAEESLKRFKSIADEQTIGNAIANLENNLIYFNEAFAQMHGYNAEELIGKNLSICYSKKQIAKINTIHGLNEWLVKKAGSTNEEVWHVRKDGSVFPALMNLAIIKDEKGETLFFAISVMDISIRKKAEEALKKREKELGNKTKKLEKINAALNILLQKRDEDKKSFEKKMLFNVRRMVEPYLEKLENSILDEKQKLYVRILKKNLNDIISTFPEAVSSKYLRFTPAELEVASLVKLGMKSKEIATALNTSYRTVEVHRENIRKKLNLKNKKNNLRTHLLSFP